MIRKSIPSSMNKYNCTAIKYTQLLRIARHETSQEPFRFLSIHSISLSDCNMLPMEAEDAAYQGCLPSCELHMHSRLLTVRRTGKVESS